MRTKARLHLVALMVAALSLVVACSGANSSQSTVGEVVTVLPPPEDIPLPPELSGDRVALGEALYQQQCASCHKSDLSGDPDWRTPNDDGTYPPPPHNASGHTWHHPDRLLLEIIRDGTGFPESRMPAFGGVLTDDEILAILDFFKSSWGTEEREFQWQVTWQDEQSDS